MINRFREGSKSRELCGATGVKKRGYVGGFEVKKDEKRRTLEETQEEGNDREDLFWRFRGRMRDGVAEKEGKNCAFPLIGCREGRNPEAKGRVQREVQKKRFGMRGTEEKWGRGIELRFCSYSDSNSNPKLSIYICMYVLIWLSVAPIFLHNSLLSLHTNPYLPTISANDSFIYY